MKMNAGNTPGPPVGADSQIFDYSPIGMAFVAPDGRWLEVNGAFCKLVGYSETELLGRAFLDITHPEDIQIGRDNVARQVAGEISTFQVEKRYVHKDGRIITVLLSSKLIRDSQRRPCHFICQMLDITARKKVEEEMRWKTAFLEAQVNSSLDGILVVDQQGNKIAQNERFNDIFKIPRSIAISNCDKEQLRWVASLVKDPVGFTERVGYLYAHPDERGRDEIDLKDGTCLDRYSAPVIGADGTHFGRIWTFRDVTLRKEIDRSLRESEARYQRMAGNVPGMVYQLVLRRDGGTALPFVSAGCCEIFCLQPEQLQSEPTFLVKMVHPEDRADYEQSLAASASSLEPWNWQGRIVRPVSNEVRSVQAAARPERQASGDIIWDGVLVDVTERKQDDENRRAKEEAERTNQAKNKFLSRLSHELRTPLNAILGFGQVLSLSSLGEQDALALNYILKGGRHLLSLVDEVLDFSRAETGELHLTLREVDPLAITRECVGLVARLAAARGISCMVREPSHRLAFWCDEDRLRQILLNLLSNAIKYNRENGRVTVDFKPSQADRLRLTVSDTGKGISAEGLARLFIPFERLEHENSRIEGTGLGLVVSKRVAEAMDGSVGVESKIGRGSKFWIDLPRAQVPNKHQVRKRDISRDLGMSVKARYRAKLLYIEDNESNVKVVEMALAQHRPDWSFMSTCDGREGLEHARRFLPDLILLDLHIAGMTGQSVLDAMRSDPVISHIPIVVLSADATLLTRELVLAKGADAYLTKPFEMDEFLETLEAGLNKRERADQRIR